MIENVIEQDNALTQNAKDYLVGKAQEIKDKLTTQEPANEEKPAAPAKKAAGGKKPKA